MEKVIKILMERDGLSKTEAKALVLEVREMIYQCGGSIVEAEEIMLEELGLEMDYLFDIL